MDKALPRVFAQLNLPSDVLQRPAERLEEPYVFEQQQVHVHLQDVVGDL